MFNKYYKKVQLYLKKGPTEDYDFKAEFISMEFSDIIYCYINQNESEDENENENENEKKKDQ